MTKIKFCGMMRIDDVLAANELNADYIGFVFAPGRKRTVSHESAKQLKEKLNPGIFAVGVFVDQPVDEVASLLRENIIDIAQLHGNEDEEYISELRSVSGRPVIKALQYTKFSDEESFLAAIRSSSADYVLIDSGTGSGETFPWDTVRRIERPYFLAGGLHPGNVSDAVRMLHPYAVDVSSGIETDGLKDKEKMTAFAASLRKEEIV